MHLPRLQKLLQCHTPLVLTTHLCPRLLGSTNLKCQCQPVSPIFSIGIDRRKGQRTTTSSHEMHSQDRNPLLLTIKRIPCHHLPPSTLQCHILLLPSILQCQILLIPNNPQCHSQRPLKYREHRLPQCPLKY